MQLFVVRLNVAVPGIMTVNRFIAETSYSPTALLHVYWSTGLELLGQTLREHGLLLVAAAVAVIAPLALAADRGRGPRAGGVRSCPYGGLSSTMPRSVDRPHVATTP